MKYLMFVVADPALAAEAEPYDGELTIEEWVEDVDRRGKRVTGERLRGVDDATTVRVSKGEVLVTDGPFTETQGVDRRLRHPRVRRPRRGHRDRVPAPDGQRRQARAAAVLADED